MSVVQSDRDRDNNRQIPARYPLAPETYPDDEISLVDLWLVLAQRKLLIAGVCAAAVALGLAAALLQTDTYEYTTSMQIARTGSGLLESPETVRAKLETSYIPFVLNEQIGSREDRFNIGVSIPGGSDLIVLKSEGASEREAQYVRLHRAVIEQVSKDHATELAAARRTLEAERARIERDLEGLQDKAQALANKEGRLQQRRELTERRLDETAEAIRAVQQRRREVVAAQSGPDRTAALVLIDGEIQTYRQRRAELRDRLDIDLPAEREAVSDAVAENRRSRTKERAALSAIEARLANLRETQAITSTMRSKDPKGPGGTTVVVLAAVIGLMLGVFAAFFAEFLAKVRERRQSGDRAS